MNYFSHLKRICSRFVKSFKYDYVPPSAQCNPPIKLAAAIQQCSNQGKLLIINLTLNGVKVNVPLDFPEEDYVVYSAPFNSPCTFSLAKNFQFDTIPFVGLFFCRSKEASDMQLIDKILDADDYIRVGAHFRRLSRELYDRRDKYLIDNESRNIINDQDQQYNEILLEAQKKEEIEKKQILRETKIEETKQLKIKTAVKRFKSMPNPPLPSDPSTISIRFNLTGKKTKVREFSASDKASLLYDYVSVDYAPNSPKILYGFPQKTLSHSDLNRTLSDLNFAKKENVYVESDDEEEEEEEVAE